MRGVRWLLLLAIATILAAIGGSYYTLRVRQAREAPPPPPQLPSNVAATSDAWIHTVYDGNRPVVEIRAEKMRQIREPSEFELENVELRIFQPGGYDRVRCGLARFDVEEGSLRSAGSVEITLDVPQSPGSPENRLLRILTSGVRFDTRTGKATTDQPTQFRFARGEGSSRGATYDPTWNDLRMHQDARLTWYGDGTPGSAMHVEAGEVVYKEDQSRIYLRPWSRLRKGALSLEAAESVVTIEDDTLRRLDAQGARGVYRPGGREVDFAAERLTVQWASGGAIEKITGDGSARLVTRDAAAETSVASRQLFLDFLPQEREGVLQSALALGSARLESRPVARDQAVPPPIRVLSSETIKAVLRPGGQEFDRIETHQPGTVEFVPSAPGQQRRRVEGERLWMVYGAQNRLKLFRADEARTWTDGRPDEKGEPGPPMATRSRVMFAHFHEDTGAAERIEQSGEFSYARGEERAQAETAFFEPQRNLVLLRTAARISNPGGSTSATEILLDEKQGVYTASGRVSSTRLPEEGGGASGMLDAAEPVHATAERMVASSDGGYVSYEGAVALWQGADRLHADRVEINRKAGTLAAAGHVVNRFAVRSTAAPRGRSTPSFTVVRSEAMSYLEQHRSAHYRGSAHLEQPGLEIRAGELRAYFRDEAPVPGSAGAAVLDHAIADGAVRIVQTTGERTRTGASEHAEYYVSEDKVVLTGGIAKLADSERGTAEGRQLTYYASDDRLLVDGAEALPAVSRLRKRK